MIIFGPLPSDLLAENDAPVPDGCVALFVDKSGNLRLRHASGVITKPKLADVLQMVVVLAGVGAKR